MEIIYIYMYVCVCVCVYRTTRRSTPGYLASLAFRTQDCIGPRLMWTEWEREIIFCCSGGIESSSTNL